jgi:carbon-monoxide dehydrogenase medium subunit
VYGYPAPFAYHRPEDIEEAVALLAGYGGQAAALAGGMSLIPKLKARERRPSHIVDIGRLGALAGEPTVDGGLIVPALTPYRDLARSPLVRRAVPVLAEAAAQVADPQVRNAATLGGAVAEVYPSADMPATLIALGARLHCLSADGERTRCRCPARAPAAPTSASSGGRVWPSSVAPRSSRSTSTAATPRSGPR